MISGKLIWPIGAAEDQSLETNPGTFSEVSRGLKLDKTLAKPVYTCIYIYYVKIGYPFVSVQPKSLSAPCRHLPVRLQACSP